MVARPGDAEEEQNVSIAACVQTFILCTSYITVSTILIRFNKVMMQADHFPFAVALSSSHMMMSCLLCTLLYAIAPSFFPAMEKTRGRRLDLMRWFIPIGACFAVMLFASNKAYTYCSVTLLQFMKEANVMVVFLISCLVGLQSINRLRLVLLIWVIASAAVSVSGDIRFSAVGIAFQASSQLAECVRVVLGEFVLTGQKLDPLTYMVFLAPISFVILVVANFFTWDPQIWPALKHWWPLICVNACVAFVLNVLVAKVIKEISAVGFVLTGLTKDIIIVVLSCIMFGEPITVIQWSAFAGTVVGVAFWSLLKINPNALPVKFLEKALCMKQAGPSETTPLADKGRP